MSHNSQLVPSANQMLGATLESIADAEVSPGILTDTARTLASDCGGVVGKPETIQKRGSGPYPGKWMTILNAAQEAASMGRRKKTKKRSRAKSRLAFNRSVVLRYRFFLEQKNLAPSTINVRLAAVRRLAFEAADTGLLSPELAAGIGRVKGAKRLGVRIGNWLTVEQSRTLLAESGGDGPRGKRDRAILALLIGCRLRRAELVGLGLEDFQVREEHWVIADLIGKGKHIRTVPVPVWTKRAVDEWTDAAKISAGTLFRRVGRLGKIWGAGLTPKAIWHIVKAAAKRADIKNLAPHDLRRTCARLCHLAGGELEQIQFLLGHASVQTTEHYLGCKQKLRHAVNDNLGLENV